MNPEMIGGLVRHLGGFAGGALAARGIGDASLWEGFFGALFLAASGGWSIWVKTKANKVLTAANIPGVRVVAPVEISNSLDRHEDILPANSVTVTRK